MPIPTRESALLSLDNETQLGTSCDDDASVQTTGDRRGRDDSDAWTMPSLADDANTVYTNFSVRSLFASAGLHRTESFERDRQVSLRNNDDDDDDDDDRNTEHDVKKDDDAFVDFSYSTYHGEDRQTVSI
jgi:hypothetical protein